ncbi:DUF7522 family protein [Haloparvum sedimenti]|uniref:DUF7522 family protein n=1 Tax=Haloparvum sedimenti TaxID=1678448 RepID=UPI00071E7D17|nr:hypothetical protein [Haloparvum sedimenti]
MKRDAARTLTRYCRERLDRQLRAVFVYERDSHEVMHMREDLRSEYETGDFDRFAAAAWDIHESLHTSGMNQSTLGRQLSTVQVFENAYAFQFPGWEGGGVVATFDRTVGTQLHSFIENCWREIVGEQQ